MNKEKFIEAVRDWTIIYDQSDKCYCDSEKKDMAWKEIGRQVNQPH